jgi:DNA-binding NtrC family response regulator
MPMRLLLVEDKDSFRRLLVQALAGSVWETTAVAEPAKALELLETEAFDVLVTDLRLPGFSGLELLQKAKRVRPGLRAILMSAYGEPRDIVEAMRCGADDFLPKPFDLDLFLALLDRLRALVGAPPPDPREPWVTRSAAMAELELQLRKVAETSLPVLFLGERGTGKGRAARRLQVLGRPDAPFTTRTASVLTTKVIDLDLLRVLQGGSLYLANLDDLDEGSGEALAKLMVSPMGQAVRWLAGAEELAKIPSALRLAFGALQLRLAPLRERKEDLLPIFRVYLERAAQAGGRTPPDLDKPVERQILEHPWLGNVRELVTSAHATLRLAEGLLVKRLALEQADSRLVLGWPPPGTLDSMLRFLNHRAEAALLQRALDSAGGEPSQAAQTLGLSVRALGLRLREHGMAVKE